MTRDGGGLCDERDTVKAQEHMVGALVNPTFDFTHPEVVEAVRRALAEDIGTGDITTNLTVEAGRRARGQFFAREPMVVAGTELLALIYSDSPGPVSLVIHKRSGARAEAGECLAQV